MVRAIRRNQAGGLVHGRGVNEVEKGTEEASSQAAPCGRSSPRSMQLLLQINQIATAAEEQAPPVVTSAITCT